MSEKNGLVKNASFLMMATLISRVIGLLYRSPLGVVLGTVGLGYYGYANNVYVILLLISAYSIPMAVSKVVSERLALKQYRNAQKVFHGALLYAMIVGGVAALVAFFSISSRHFWLCGCWRRQFSFQQFLALCVDIFRRTAR